MEEIWKSVVGYEGLYEISSAGRIRSVDRLGTDGRKLKGLILKPRSNDANKEKGYLAVSLYKNDIKSRRYVHRQVALAFLINSDVTKNIVNHIDGNKFNNNVNNLEWTDSFGNMQHASKNGLLDGAKEILSDKSSKECSLVSISDGEIINFKNQTMLSLFLGFNQAWFAKAIKRNKNINKTLEKKGYKLNNYTI